MPFIYVSEGVNSYMNLFLDNTKIMKQITNIDRCWELQEDDKSLRRNQNWKMRVYCLEMACFGDGAEEKET